jgi:hypothetical protein
MMTVEEVAAYLRVHPTTVYKLVKRKESPPNLYCRQDLAYLNHLTIRAA